MKRNTLIKLLIVAMFCLLVIPMIASCGTKYTVTFDPNGGTLDEADLTMEIGEGEKLPKLPKPSRNTKVYKFLGWFEDGDEDEEYERGDEVEYDITLVALWEIIGETVTVEFDPTNGALDSEETYVVIPKGGRLSDVLKALPTGTLEGYNLGGWYMPDGTTKVALTTVFNSDTVITAKWDQIIYCKDGTENHNYNAWQDKTLKATCLEGKLRSHTCSICGYEEIDEVQPATGHRYGDWVNGTMARTRTCITCDTPETQTFINVTKEEGYEAKLSLETGDSSVFAAAILPSLIDGNFEIVAAEGGGMATKNNEIRILLTLKEAQYVDVVCISSNSYNATGSAYELIITYADGTTSRDGQYTGTMGYVQNADGTKTYKVSQFDISKEIKSVEMYIPMGSYGQCFFGEIALGCVPTAE